MNYVVYNKETTITFHLRYVGTQYFATEGAAKAALTRHVKKTGEDPALYAVASDALFHGKIEKQVLKRNLISGKEFEQPINTPLCCDPSSETYHSM